MTESRHHHVRAKLKATIVIAAALALFHWAVWVALTTTMGPGQLYEFLTIGDFQIRLGHVENFGASFGLFEPDVFSRAVSAAVTILALAGFVIPLLIIPVKYKAQLVAVELLCASGITDNLERIVTGSSNVYFDLGLGTLRWPMFNIYGLVIASGFAFVYMLTFLRFFRLLPSYKRTQLRQKIPRRLRDPLYENRKPLKVMLAAAITLAALKVASIGLVQFLEVRGTAGTALVLASVGFVAVLVGGMSLGPLILFWRVVPTRAIDVIYLRSFRFDRRSWKTVRRLRRDLGRQLRVSGVVDPDESRRWWYLLYWLTNPFMFALGDVGQVNATRHNIFLEGNWKSGIRIAFSGASCAVFDCRTLTENVVWEIGASLEMIKPGRVFFIIPGEASAERFQASLGESGLAETAVARVPAENYISESDTATLAGRIREALGA